MISSWHSLRIIKLAGMQDMCHTLRMSYFKELQILFADWRKADFTVDCKFKSRFPRHASSRIDLHDCCGKFSDRE